MTKKLDSMLENPNVQQFLDFLGKAEGADYDVIVGGAKFDDFSKHPARVGLRTKYGPSTAAGKYQITKTTFDDVAPKLKLKDFSPRSQDLAALFLIQRRGALDDVASGNWDEAISKLGKEWASLPSSPYTQPKRDEEFVRANLPAADEEPVRSIVSRETVPTDQGPSRDLEQLPESYRLALAANYLADTEDEPVVEQAMRAAEEAEASGGGGGQIPALGAFALSQQAVDPFQFVLRRPEEEQAVMDQGPRRRPVPRMPQGFADGGSASKSGVNRLKQARAVPAMPRFQDGGEVDLAEQMTVGTIPRGPVAIPRYDPVDANPANLMEQMSVGTLPEQEQPSPVDTAVSDYLRMQSQLLTDPKEWFRASGQRLAETIERDPEEFAMGFTGAGIGGILKPKGGTFLSGPASEFTSGMDSFKGILEARIRRNPGTPVAERGKAAMDFFDKQFKNYYQRKLGSPDDALREAFVQGRFKGKDLLSQENLDFLANQRVLANQTENPQVSNAARQNLEKWYDEWIGLSTVVPESMPRPLTESLLRRQAKLQEQGFPVSQDQLYRGASEQLPASSMDPGSLRAIREGDVAYDATSSNLIEGRMRYLDDYLGTLSPQQIRNMRFEDAMINAERYHELLERAAQRNLTPRELFEGREKVIDVGDRRWTDVKNPKALEIEGQYMDHCIGGAGYCEELTSGVGKHFSLQDIKTGEPHTTLSIYRSPFSESGKHVIIKQIKGRSNSAPEKYFPEIEAFLDHYEKQVGKIYITENRNHIPLSFRGSEYTEMPRGYRGLE